MKKLAITWSILAVVFGAAGLQSSRTMTDLPFSVTPNWFTVIPALVAFFGLVAYLVRKEIRATELKAAQTRSSVDAEFASRPLRTLATSTAR